MSALVHAEAMGVSFQLDRMQRVTTPAVARLRRRVETVWGLRGLDLTLEPGDGVAVVGPSGSGKTTLLRTMAGVLAPDEGRIEVRGRIGSLLSTEAGLVWSLSGRENCDLLGVLGGLSARETRSQLDWMKERSGVGEAFDRPVSTYSQGMLARLGFAVAECLHPQLLLLDEVHEALDHEFRALVEARAAEIVAGGGIVVATGHDHELLGRLCDRALWLEGGRVCEYGDFEDIVAAYVGGSAHSGP
jgi:ABC-type polysaccharide/polyol phosphate transport system ATPase subunit